MARLHPVFAVLICSFLIGARAGKKAVIAAAASDDDDGTDMRSTGGSTNADELIIAGLTITCIGVAARKCKCCGDMSDSTSPLASSFDEDEWEGKRPWVYYRRHPNTATF